MKFLSLRRAQECLSLLCLNFELSLVDSIKIMAQACVLVQILTKVFSLVQRALNVIHFNRSQGKHHPSVARTWGESTILWPVLLLRITVWVKKSEWCLYSFMNHQQGHRAHKNIGYYIIFKFVRSCWMHALQSIRSRYFPDESGYS